MAGWCYRPELTSSRRFRGNEVKNAEERAPGPDELESGLANKMRWFTIPAAAKLLRETIGSAVFPAPEPLLATPVVVGQQDLTFRPADTGHFLQRIDRVEERAQRERG